MKTGLPKLRCVAPICLSAPGLALAAAGGSGIADMSTLCNQLRSPIVIDSISFYVRNTQSNLSGWLGGSIKCRLSVGRFDLTSGLVPIWNFGPVIDDSFENLTATSSLFGAGGVNDTVAFYKWKLPVPLIVRQGDAITPYFENSYNNSSGLTNLSPVVFISFQGRVLAEDQHIPDMVPVPYVSIWDPLTTPSLNSFPSVSTPTSHYYVSFDALKNPFPTPLRVQRFIGRLRSEPASATIGAMDVPILGSDCDDTTNGPVTVKAQDSKGYSIIQDFTPWSYVFQEPRRSFITGNLLQPNESYSFEVQTVTITTGNEVRPQISMIGYRMEAY